MSRSIQISQTYRTSYSVTFKLCSPFKSFRSLCMPIFPSISYKPLFKTGTWADWIFGIAPFDWFCILIITESSLTEFDRYCPTKKSLLTSGRVYFSQQLYFMSSKAYIGWNGLRLGWASAEFLDINQYISEIWVLFLVCFWAPNFLCSLTLSWKKMFWRTFPSPHQRSKVLPRCKAAVGQIKILAEFLTVCLVAEDKDKMVANFYELIISSLLSRHSYPTTLLSLTLHTSITVSMNRNS